MRYTRLVFLSIFIWIFSIPTLSQVISQSKNKPNEVSIAVNHQDESQIVCGSNNNNLYISADTGKNWVEKKQYSSLGAYGDPSIFCDDNGIFYHAHLSKTAGKPWPECFDRMVVQRSLDGGQTWSDGVGVGYNGGKMQDKEWLAGDLNKNSPYYGNIYLSWTEFDVYGSSDTNHHTRILFARSTDQGISFSKPVIVSDQEGDCKDDDGTVEGATVATGPNGEIYIVWAGNGKLWLDVSYDGGKTFGKDKEIATLHEGWTLDIPKINRSNGMPFIVCNQKTGAIWVTYADRAPGENARVHLIGTDSQMVMWSHTIPSLPNKGDAFVPNIALNERTGEVGVVYYQAVGRRHLTVELFTLNSAGDAKRHVLTPKFKKPGKHVFFGDYIDVDYFGDGFIAAWTSYERRKLLIRVRKVTDS